MHCPRCDANQTEVNDTRVIADGRQVRRRRRCLACNHRWTTYEVDAVRLAQLDAVRAMDEDLDALALQIAVFRKALLLLPNPEPAAPRSEE